VPFGEGGALEQTFAQALSSDNNFFYRQFVEECESIQRSDCHALIAMLHGANGAQPKVRRCSNISLLERPIQSLFAQNSANRLLEGEPSRLFAIGHT
jgi:hypothetical protein